MNSTQEFDTAESDVGTDVNEEDSPNVEINEDTLNHGLDIVPEETDEDVEISERPATQGRPDSHIVRVPSQQGRARLARTPSSREKSNLGRELEPLLITELPTDEDILKDERPFDDNHDIDHLSSEDDAKPNVLNNLDSDSENGDTSDDGYGGDNNSVSLSENFEERHVDENYDTDLDKEDDDADYDHSIKGQYEQICHELGIVPVSYFTRHINDTELTMRYRCLGPDSTKALALVLKDSVNLERLNLQGNWIGEDGGRAVARMLMENEYILDVNVADNKLCSAGLGAICQMLLVNTGLRKLDLSGNDLGDHDIDCLLDVLEQNKYLKELYLGRNKFGQISGDLLGPALSGNDTLEVIDLSWNHIRKSGALSVANGLKENVRLKKCDLSWNGFGPEGGSAIAEALTCNDSLHEIDMSGNRLNGDTAAHISKALTVNDSLQVLRMGNNLITTTGAIALATSISRSDNSEIEHLDISDVPVEYEFLKLVEDIRMEKPTFIVEHGPVLRSGNTNDDIGKPAVDPYGKKEPVLVLQNNIVINDARLLGLLKRFVTEESYVVTPKQFLDAVEDLAVPYNKTTLEEAVHTMDKNPDGLIEFGDLVKQQELHERNLQ